MSARISAASTYLIRTATLPSATPFTVTFRIYLVSDRNVAGVVFDMFNAGNLHYQDVRVTSSGTILELRTNANNAASSTNMAVTTWYHVAMVRNGTSFTIYVDGTSVGTLTSTISLTPSGILFGSNTVSWVNARIADAAIWEAALDATDVAAERDSYNTAARATNLWAYWPLIGDGNDVSGNARHLTPTGSITWEADPPNNNQSKTVTDTGSGTDTLGNLLVMMGLADSGAGTEGFGASATAGATDSGAGVDLAQVLALITAADSGGGVDALAQLLARITAPDAGVGVDALTQLRASLTTVDSGVGVDLIPQGLAQFSVADAGVGVDGLAEFRAWLTAADNGLGSELIQAIAYLALTDEGFAVDELIQALGYLGVNDVGMGLDSVAQVAAWMLAADSAVGTDTPVLRVAVLVNDAGVGGEALVLTVTLNVSEVGSGTDFITLMTESLRSILETGIGTDAVSLMFAPFTVAEAGSGADATGIQVTLTLADTGSSLDGVFSAVLIAIAELASGADVVGSIGVNIQVDDLAQALDILGQVNAVLSVSDAGSGMVNVAIQFDSASQIVSVIFTLSQRRAVFSFATRSAVFEWATRSSEFELHGGAE